MKLALSAMLLYLACNATAQENQQGRDTLQHTLNEVIVMAPIAIQQVKNWPGSVAMLDSLSIQSGNAYQLTEQLNTLPGVFIQQGTLSTNRITIRGIGSRTPYNSNRIKAYWGNMPLTDGDGVTSIEDIGLNDINTLQVVKGPSSALYGAGLGGVILINPWETLNTTSTLLLKSEAGSYGTFSNQINAGIRHNKGQTEISASSLHTNGYRNNSTYQRYNITLKGKYNIGMHYLHYLYNYRYLDGQIPSSLDSIDFYNSPSKAADSWQAIGGYEQSERHMLNIGLSSLLHPRLTHHINVFGSSVDLDELRPFNQLDEGKNAIGIRDKLSYRTLLLRAEIGLEAMIEKNTTALYGVKEHNSGELLNKTKLQRSYLNVFGLLEYTLQEKLILQAAFNFNQTRYSSQGLTPPSDKIQHRYPVVVSPRLGINYQLSHSSHLFVSAGHGFSAPSVEEAQMPDGSFNAAIKPEEGVHAEIGYRYATTNHKTQAEATLYMMRMKNLLVTKRESEDIFYGVNAGKTKHHGLEMNLSQLIDWDRNNHIKLTTSYFQSFNRFESFIDDGVDYSNKHLPGIPSYNLHMSTLLKHDNWQLSLNYSQFGKQYLNDSNTKRYDDYGKVGAKISHHISFKALSGTVYLGADNLFDTHYASMVLINAPSFGNSMPRYYYPGLPFNLFGGISVMIK